MAGQRGSSESQRAKRRQRRPRWEAFPATLRADVDVYLSGLRKVRKSASGRRHRPCKNSTINVRRARLIAFARKAVASGVPIGKLASLRDLLSADVVERVLYEYWPDREEPPRVYVIDLVAMLTSISLTVPDMDEASVEFLDDMRAELEGHRSGGLTDKNLALIRQVMTPGVWPRVVALPLQLMVEARGVSGSIAREGCRAGADGLCDRYSHRRADPPRQSGCHHFRHAHPPARRAARTPLAGVSALRCEK